jgi:hypothetical protein
MLFILGAGTYTADELIKDAAVTQVQVLELAEATKGQSHSAIWNAHRKGRITASNSYRIVNSLEPGSFAVRAIMQYDLQKLNNIPAVRWGLDNENNAKDLYILYMSQTHDCFQFEETGLVLYCDFPFLAASPDGLSNCNCHRPKVVEIKCPYKYWLLSPTDPSALSDPNYFLNKNGLKPSHKYYCQVQTQMLVTNSSKCDFVVWTTQGISIVEVLRDNNFIKKILDKVQPFVELHLIPELIAQKLKYRDGETEVKPNETIYCTCRKPSYGHMINCANDDCLVDWFHYECVGLTRKPRGRWYCNQCSSI